MATKRQKRAADALRKAKADLLKVSQELWPHEDDIEEGEERLAAGFQAVNDAAAEATADPVEES